MSTPFDRVRIAECQRLLRNAVVLLEHIELNNDINRTEGRDEIEDRVCEIGGWWTSAWDQLDQACEIAAGMGGDVRNARDARALAGNIYHFAWVSPVGKQFRVGVRSTYPMRFAIATLRTAVEDATRPKQPVATLRTQSRLATAAIVLLGTALVAGAIWVGVGLLGQRDESVEHGLRSSNTIDLGGR